MPKDNGKQNPDKLYTTKYQKHVACSCGEELVCVDDTFSKPFKSYLGGDSVYNFTSSMIGKSKCYTDINKKNFSKELVLLK